MIAGLAIDTCASSARPMSAAKRMVRLWLDRLRTAPRSDCGSRSRRWRPNSARRITGYFVDSDWPDCWVVSGETVLVARGTSVPAHGVLRKAYIIGEAAFFLDAALSCGHCRT